MHQSVTPRLEYRYKHKAGNGHHITLSYLFRVWVSEEWDVSHHFLVGKLVSLRHLKVTVKGKAMTVGIGLEEEDVLELGSAVLVMVARKREEEQ
jgi:hypothetical protein